MAPIFCDILVVPLPVPKRPAKTQPNPSIIKPLLMACFGGGLAPKFHFKQEFNARRKSLNVLYKNRI